MSNNGLGVKFSALRNMHDLVDIGKTGQAQQSSVSRWSRPDDAQNAVLGVDRDFAFHTDAEEAPWWSLTFEQPAALQYLVLENRRNTRFRHLADNLSVVVETENGPQTLHEGVQPFGVEREDNALVLALTDCAPVKSIKVTAHTGGGYLHLSRIRVLANAEDVVTDSSEHQLPFLVANRADGFGERLKALLNAMVIAKRLPGEFRFGWRTMADGIAVWHDVLPVEQTFTKKFRDLYFQTPAEISALDPVKVSEAAMNKRSVFRKTYLVSQARLEAQCPSYTYAKTKDAFKPCFDEIEFTPHLERGRDCAKAVDLTKHAGSVALHLRAGDIIFGRYRKMGRYHRKACPFPIAERIAAEMQADGRQLVIFGQDEAFIEYLVDRYGAISATSLAKAHAFDSKQQALFDICLMARCDEIICGSSGFANLACWIGGVKGVSPYRYYDADTTLKLLEDAGHVPENADPRVSDLQRSFAIWLAFILSDRKIADTPQYMTLLDQAITLDPDNEFFKIVKACSLIHMGDPAQADQILLECVRPDAAHSETLQVLSGVHPDGKAQIDDQLPYLESAAAEGYPGAALYLALCHKALRNTSEVAQFAEIYRTNKGDIITPLEAELEAV